MSFAAVLAAMPDLLARALAEHIPDADGRCRECREDGTAAAWPCAMRLIADEASGMVHPAPPQAPPPSVETAPAHQFVSDAWDPIADRRAYRRDGFRR